MFLSQASSCAMEQGLPPPLAAQDSWGAGIIKEFMAEAAPSLSSAQAGMAVSGRGWSGLAGGHLEFPAWKG